MNKLALSLLAAIPAALFALTGCPNGSNVITCTGTDDTPCTDAASPVCLDGTCSAPQCEGDDQCQATSIGGSDNCSSDADCSAADGERCLEGDTGNNHCVIEQQAGDPACADQLAGTSEVTGKDVDGSDVTFCGEDAVSCDDPGRCSGGQFG